MSEPGAGSVARGLRRVLVIFAMVVATLAVARPALAERRVALVIGNAAYVHASVLKNPVQDATAVAATLRTLDFNVTMLTDLDKIGMERALRRFAADLDHADVALFYYSGHAVQVADRNYLVPVSATLDGAKTLVLDTLALQDVNAVMSEAGVKVQLLFLDACRDDPFGNVLSASQGSQATRGLARVDTSSGSLVVFSTSPGQVALDGTGALSPFTSAFTRYAPMPKLEIRQVVSRVRADVAAATDDRQLPWDSSSLLGDFYLMPNRPPPTFDRLARATVGPGDAPTALHLSAPVQPEGGPVGVAITHAPTLGHLTLPSRAVAEQDRLTAAEFADLAYVGTAAGAQDAFSFAVNDAWGNNEVGLVLIERAGGALAAAQPAAPSATLVAAQPLASDGVSLVGLGPNLLFRKTATFDKTVGDRRVQLASNVPFGQIVLGDRVIEEGRSIGLSDVNRLAFIPPAGSEGRHVEALFKPLEGAPGEVRVDIDVQMTDCDRLAGDRLDFQGVSEGVLTGQIDVTAALPACEKAVKARPSIARFVYEVGRVYAALGRDADALKAYQQAADLGHVRALWALGNHDIYVQPTDAARGKAVLERAVAAGDVYAIHSLGNLYYEGRGVPRDWAKAKSLFEAAARVGQTFSMNVLGRMYQRGEATPVDLAMTRRYWEESAARGDIYGIDDLGFVYLDGLGVEKDPARALAYFKQAADLGHPEAPNNIGRMYVLGLGVPSDFAEARKWDRLGADRGDAWAALNLGDLIRLGRGGEADPVEAGYFYARAAASTNRLDAAEQGRRQLATLDRRQSQRVLRRLLQDVDPAAATASDAALAGLAQKAFAAKKITFADHSPVALLVAAAQAVWIERSVRADLF